MVDIKEVDLGGMGVAFPEGGVAMVVAQPFLGLEEQPPFACADDARDRLLACIDATLDVARLRHHGAPKTHFTVFPEYTIPGAEGIARIDAAMAAQDWPTGTVVLGGIEGMTPAQFRELVAMPNVCLDTGANSLDRLQGDHWVNCSVTWVKLPSGEVRRWVQPKISPAWAERAVQHNSMYCGRSIFVFKGRFENAGRPFRFHSLLCFDWIGAVGNKQIWEWVLDSTDQAAKHFEALLPLTWVFVMQCNDEPCHASFMGQVQHFFNQNQYTSVERRGTCLIMANVAGKERPGRVKKYGRSALIHAPMQFSKANGGPTYCNGGEPFRAGNPLGNFSDSLFRESGACIHSFIQADPVHAPQGSGGRTTALLEATVHPFPGVNDPRTNGRVPSAIKWLNDDLDESRTLATRHPAYQLAPTSGAASHATTSALRGLPPGAAAHSVRIACVGANPNPDQWGVAESSATEHLHHTLSLLKLAGYECDVHGNLAHATTGGERPLDLVAVRGSSHSESDAYIAEAALRTRLPLVIVSRDADNTSWGIEEMTILDTPSETDEVDITDPRSAIRRVGYQTFLEAFRTSSTVEQLRERFDAVLY